MYAYMCEKRIPCNKFVDKLFEYIELANIYMYMSMGDRPEYLLVLSMLER